MDHPALPLVTTLAAAFGLALLFGFVAVRLRLPALVGYLLAGVVIGPATPGYVADVALAGELAEIGVMLLMFGVGLHFSLRDLLAVRGIAVPGAVVQMAAATALGAGVGWLWGWPPAGALVFGLALSVASTVVLLKALERGDALETPNGRIAVGWLVVEDLAMVVVLVLLPPLAGLLGGRGPVMDASGIGLALGRTLLEVAVFIALMLLVGRRLMPWLLWQVARTGSRELFVLAVIAAAVTLAVGSSRLFGVSFALGAFFAGMVLRESAFSHRAAHETQPLRDAFAVLFFVSVGMLFDPDVLVEAPLRVLAVVGIIMLGKSIAAGALVLLLRYPLNTALTVSASLAQIGEFSFILAGLGVSLGLLPAEGQSLILAGALISIALNPVLFAAVDPLQRRLDSAAARALARRDDPLAQLPDSTEPRFLADHVVIVGWGPLGQRLGEALAAREVPFVVADANRDLVEALRARGQAAVFGDATQPETLVQAHIARARLLVVTTPQALEARRMAESARLLNPGIHVAVCAADPADAAWLERERAGTVFLAERELERAMARHVLHVGARLGASVTP